MGVLTTASVDPGALFGPIPPTLTLTDPVLMIGHMTADQRPDVHTVKMNINHICKGPGLVEWIPYVRAARDASEQNLEALLVDGHLFYRCTQHIPSHEELFVWYTPGLARTVGVPEIHPAFIQGDNMFVCPYCCKEFVYPYSLRTHIRFKCERNPYLPKTTTDNKVLMLSPIALQSESVSQSKGDFLANNVSPPDSLKSLSPEQPRGEKRKLDDEFDRSSGDLVAKRLEVEDLSPRSDGLSPPRRLSLTPPQRLSLSPKETSIHEEPQNRQDTLSAFTKVEKLISPDGLIKEKDSQNNSIYRHPYPTASPVLAHVSLAGRHPVFSSASVPVRPSQLDPLTRMMVPHMAAATMGPRSNHPVSMSLKENIPISMANMTREPIKSTADLRNLINTGKLPFHPDWRFHFPFYRSQNPIVETILHSATNGIHGPFPPQLNLAQNWCAKCNATFRMTSDLVYHMRSHHKLEKVETGATKRKTIEKLKCEVCGESFKERHHLTRHMTSHQEA